MTPETQESRRDPFGWILLAVLSLSLIGVGLSSYFQRPGPNQGSSVRSAETAIKLETSMRAMAEQATNGSSRLADSSSSADTLMSLDKNPSDEARRLRSAYRLLLDKKIPEKDEAELKKAEFGRDILALRDEAIPQPQAEAIAVRYGASQELAPKMVAAVAGERAEDRDRWSKFHNPGRIGGMLALGGIMVAAGLMGALVFLLQGISWDQHRPQWRHPLPNSDDETVDRLGMTAALGILGFFGGQLVAYQTLGRLLASAQASWLLPPLAMLTSGLFVIAVFQLRGVKLARLMGPIRLIALPQGVATWGVNLVLMIPAILVMAILNRFLPAAEHPVQEIVKGGPLAMTGAMIAAVVLAPIVEEILFRGVILSALVQRTGSVAWGIVITNFIFAAVHPTGIVAWPALFTVGVAASLVTLRTGSLLPAMVLHFVHNLFVMSMMVLVI